MPLGSRSRTSTAMRSSRSLISSVSAQRQSGFDRRCPLRGRGTEGPRPTGRRLARRGGEELVGEVVAERAAGVSVEEPGEPGSAESIHRVRVGITGGKEPQRGVVAQVGTERGVPARSEDLQQRVEPGQAGGAALDQGGVQLGGPAQRIAGTETALRDAALRGAASGAAPAAPSPAGRSWCAWRSRRAGPRSVPRRPAPRGRPAGGTTPQAAPRRYGSAPSRW